MSEYTQKLSLQLPDDVPELVGRQREVSMLLRALRRPSRTGPVLCHLYGMPGTGKSALAIHVARRLSNRFTDGVLYLDFRNQDAQQLAIAFRKLVSTPGDPLGLSDAESIPSKTSLLRSTSDARNVLLVLDNVNDEIEAAALHPSIEKSAVLVTSQSYLPFEVRQSMRLTALTRNWSLQLLSLAATNGMDDALFRGSDTAAAICGLCDDTPLALQIVGTLLKSTSESALTDMHDQLSQKATRLDLLVSGRLSMRASLDISYDRLTPEVSRRFRRLGVIEHGSFGPLLMGLRAAPSVDAAGDTKLSWEEDALEEVGLLKSLQLIEAADNGLSKVPELIRLYAAERLKKDQCEAADEVWEEFRIKVVALTDLAGRSMHQSVDEAMRELRPLGWNEEMYRGVISRVNAELGVITREAVSVVERLADVNRWRDVYEDARCLLPVLRETQQWTAVIDTVGVALRAIDELPELAVHRSILLEHLGIALRQQGQFADAIQRLLEARELLLARGSAADAASVLNPLGTVYLKLEMMHEAIDVFRQAADELRKHRGRHEDEAAALSNLLLSLLSSGERCDDWRDYKIRLFELAKHEQHDRARARLLVNLGKLVAKDGRRDEAEAMFDEALALAAQPGLENVRGMARHNLGTLRAREGDYTRAIKDLEAAVEHHQHAGMLPEVADSLLALVVVYLGTGKVGQAYKATEKARELHLEAGKEKKATLARLWQCEIEGMLSGKPKWLRKLSWWRAGVPYPVRKVSWRRAEFCSKCGKEHQEPPQA